MVDVFITCINAGFPSSYVHETTIWHLIKTPEFFSFNNISSERKNDLSCFYLAVERNPQRKPRHLVCILQIVFIYWSFAIGQIMASCRYVLLIILFSVRLWQPADKLRFRIRTELKEPASQSARQRSRGRWEGVSSLWPTGEAPWGRLWQEPVGKNSLSLSRCHILMYVPVRFETSIINIFVHSCHTQQYICLINNTELNT